MAGGLETTPIEVQLLGPLRIQSPCHGLLNLTASEEAVLALLAACPVPAHRSDLVEACAISEQTFRPLLSKLPRKLGLDEPVHRRPHRLPGMIERNPNVVTTDVDRLRAALDTSPAGDRSALRGALSLLRGRPFDGLSYVRPNPAVEAAYEEVEALVLELTRRAARSDLLTGGDDGWLVELCPSEAPLPAEVWLARLLQLVSQIGPAGARSFVDQLAGAPASFAAGPVRLQTELVARLLVASSGPPPAGRPIDHHRSVPMARALRDVMSHLADPGCRLVLVEGPAGIGKSHLFDILTGEVGGGHRPVLRGQAFADRGANDVLAQLASVPLRQLTSRLDPRIEPLAGNLVDLVDLVDRGPAPAEAVEHDRRAVRTVAELLTIACPEGALLLVDDVHLHSPDLEELIEDLVRLTPPTFKVVASVRQSELPPHSPWAGLRTGDHCRVEVGTLGRRDAEELLGPSRLSAAGPVDRQLARTEGRPLGLLVRSDSDPEAGLRAHLRASIGGRSPAAQRTLAVLAISAADLEVDPDLGGRLLSAANLSWSDLSPDVADDEILIGAPEAPRFGHSLWKEALEPVLLSHERRHLHLAAYRHLRSSTGRRGAPPAVLAWHALGAGSGLDRSEVLATVIEGANAAKSSRDYVSSRRLITDALKLEWAPAQRLQLVALRATVNRLGGWWDDALPDYRTAIEAALASDDHRRPAELVLEMAQAAWDAGPSAKIDELLVEAKRHLSPDDRLLIDQLDLCRAGGLDQDGSAGADRVGRHRVVAAREATSARLEGAELALSLLHGRQAMLGVDTPGESLELAWRTVAAAGDDVLLRAHGLQAAFVDLLRLDRRAEAGAALRAMRDLARTPASATQAFGYLNCQNCWDLQLGRFDRAQRTLGQMADFGSRLGGNTFDQILLAQQFWLARETGDTGTLRSYASGAHELYVADPTTPVWAAAEALLLVDLGSHAGALDVVVEIHQRNGGFGGLPEGPHRLATLALCSDAVGRLHGAVDVPAWLADDLYQRLDAEPQAGVLAGWPTVFIGPVQRFLGYTAAASGRQRAARSHLEAAIRADRRSPALLARSIDAWLAVVDASGADEDEAEGEGGPVAGELRLARARLARSLRSRS